ncbi:MAG: aldehyde ferredoxin oxidoreductase [Syntrophobacterales bacterium RBG_19FT_COMBO_59_10]|nr:MAG: aldehyde ferredoxin oxidoreductase [Syntrophobacterales bacterium RBG_19FT_COMBO_59_10]
MPYGYNGKILRVDLTTGAIRVEEPGEVVYRTYLGGGGLASYYLLRELKPGIDPLSADNILIFASSVISGTPVAGMVRFTVAAKSPLTGAYGEAEAGGFWGPELKFSGFDAVIVTGKAAKPSYLWINDGKVEIRSAEKIWGMETGPAQEMIREEIDEKRARIALIGPAGENLVRYACVVNELKHVNGRTGMGAVMGSKNLKAVAVRGTNKMEMHDPEKLRELSKNLTELIGQYGPNKLLRKLGTPNLIMPLNKQGLLPTRNFRTGYFEGAEKISGERMAETILKGEEGCYACAVRCKRAVEVPSGPYATSSNYGGPEYETLSSLGSLLCIDDLEAISKGNEMCNRYTLDTISTGAVIAFAMECYENGILAQTDTEGIDFTFGNPEAMLKGIEWIAFRKPGLGDLLADGVKAAAAKLGKGSEKFALHIKGQELPMHDPRGKTGQGLSFAVSPTGADHVRAPHDTPFQAPGPMLGKIAPLGILEPVDGREMGARKARNFTYLHFIWSLYESLGVCNFVAGPVWALTLTKLVEVVQAVTGWETSLWELMKVGERTVTMARVFNLREGFGRRDDTLPDRLFEPLESGALQGKGLDRLEFEDLLTLYYEAMGWDPADGVPTRGKLAELNLFWLDEFLKDKR